MKRFSLAWFLAIVSLVAVLLALIASESRNRRQKIELAKINDSLKSYDFMIDSRENKLDHARMGTALLRNLALNAKQHTELFEFLLEIDSDSLSCMVWEPPEYTSVRIFIFFQRNEEQQRDQSKSKSAWLLVENSSLDCVDYVMHTGFTHQDQIVEGALIRWILNWDQSDGTTIKYKIKETGFERIE